MELEIDCCDLFQAQIRDQAPPILDARVRRAFFAGRIPGAAHLPAEQVSHAALAPFAGAAYVLVYGSDLTRLDGVRAAQAIAELGYPVKLLTGGYAAWLAEGFPVEQAPAFAERIAAI
jgi:rhodanese-related sulfurtransferase